MRKIYLLFVLFLLPWVHYGQINDSYTWEVEDDLDGWSNEGEGEMEWIDEETCTGVGSVVTNFYSFWGFGTTNNTFTSPNLGTSNQGLVTLNLNYKVVDYYGLSGTPSSYFKITMQWSNSTSGPWNTFYEINSTNHTASAFCNLATTTFLPGPGNTYVRFVAQDLSNGMGDYYIFYDDVTISQGAAPTCLTPGDLQIVNVTKNSAKIQWQAPSVLPQTGFEYEIRTSGLPGSGSTGLVQTGTVFNSVLFKDIVSLTPSTEYLVYIRSKCLANEDSLWSSASEFITLCEHPDFVSKFDATRCGSGSVDLIANYSNNGYVAWYDSPTGGIPLFVGTNFETPLINNTTSFYVSGGSVTANTQVQVGTGLTTTSGGPGNPFSLGWGGFKNQYIFTAQELLDAGLVAGPINSLAFDVAIANSVPRVGFTIYIKNTTQSEATVTHIAMSSTDLVYSTPSYTMQQGIVPIVFANSFLWDGQSNIVVQTCWSNGDYDDSLSGQVRYNVLDNVYRATCSYADNCTPQMLLQTMTGGTMDIDGDISGDTEILISRPNIYFNGTANCASPRTEVVATVTPAPVLTLSTNEVIMCEGDSSLVTVTAGASDYNSFVWSPSDGVTGNATTGWIFNPIESTVYTLTATQGTVSSCASVINVNVSVNPLPLMLDLGDELQACVGAPLQLKIGDNTVWPSNYFNSFESTQVEGFNVSATGNVSAFTTTLVSSVGARSLNITHTSFASGYVTLSNSLDLSDFNTPYLTFDHIVALEGGVYSYDYGYVEYSLDGGTTWIVFKPADYVGTAAIVGSTAVIGQRFSTISYPDWAAVFTSADANPTNALWKPARFNFPANADLSSVKIRFKVTSDSSSDYAGWFIDNLNIKEAPVTTATWSPVTNLFTDPVATVPYVVGTNAATVYFKSDVAVAETDYTVTVISSAGCEVSQSVAISNVLVAAPVASAQAFCEEVEVTDIVVTGLTTGAVLKWFATETSTTEVTSISTTGTYYVVQEHNGCSSVRVAVEISIIGIGSAPTADLSQIFCGNNTVADLVATPLIGNTIGWFDSATSTTPLAATAALVTGDYYVAQFNGTCWSPRATVAVLVSPAPAAPVNVAQVFCGNKYLSEIDLGQGANATLNWYQTATSINVLPMTTQLVTGTHAYYVSQTINGCESSRVEIQVNIQQQLLVPVAPEMQLYCGVIQFSDLEVTASVGGIIGWFASDISTTPIDANQDVVTGTYYVAQFNGACWSDRKIVQVTINTVPSTPSNSNIHLCGNYNFGQVSVGQVSGASLNWYATATSITPFEPTANVTSGTYYVSQTIGGCESDRVMINISQTDSLGSPTVVSQTFCGSAIVGDLVSQGVPGATILWYSSSVSLNALSPNAALATGTYYAAQTVNGCISSRVPISVFVVSIAAPNVETFNFCGGATVANLVLPTPTGVVYKWFDSPSNPTQLDANIALVSGTYFVSRTQYGCESLRTPVTVNINSVPDAPTGISPQVFIEGSTINDILMDQPNVVWYMTQQNAQNGVNPLVQGMPLVNGTTYYGVIIGTNGCPSLPFALTVDVYLSDDKFVKEDLKYYPNPVEDILNVTYSERILQIEVFDLLGKRVKVKSTDDKEVNIDLSDLASGTYMIQLKTESKQQFIKVVKK